MKNIQFMYITNKPQVAEVIQDYGVQRIWVDLEYIGKEERQKNMNTVKSNHKLADISLLRPVVTTSELLVRINPLHVNSKYEIDEAIDRGADILMLPMFRTKEEVLRFLDLVNKRVKVTLLFETKEAIENLDHIMECDLINEVHVGLNDLHISYNLKFMFELLANGCVENFCKQIRKYDIPYGFGGMAKIGEGLLPAEKILAEHVRLGSSRVILSRSFCDIDPAVDFNLWKREFQEGINKIRIFERLISQWSAEQFKFNSKDVRNIVDTIVNKMKK